MHAMLREPFFNRRSVFYLIFFSIKRSVIFWIKKDFTIIALCSDAFLLNEKSNREISILNMFNEFSPLFSDDIWQYKTAESFGIFSYTYQSVCVFICRYIPQIMLMHTVRERRKLQVHNQWKSGRRGGIRVGGQYNKNTKREFCTNEMRYAQLKKLHFKALKMTIFPFNCALQTRVREGVYQFSYSLNVLRGVVLSFITLYINAHG